MIKKTLATIFLSVLFLVTQAQKRISTEFNDAVRLVAQYKSQNSKVLNGYYKLYFNNRLRVEGNNENGHRHGKWTLFNNKGNPRITGNYIHGKKHGKWRYYGQNQELKAEWYFRNDTAISHWTTYVAGENRLDIVFSNEGLAMQTVLYDASGRIRINTEKEIKNKDTLTFRSYYYENEKIHSYKELKNQKLNGRVNYYHRTGAAWEHFTYFEGELISVHIMRSDKGQPRDVGTFKNGNGSVRKYFSTGLIYSKTNYENGLKNGSYSSRSGDRLYVTGKYKNDKPAGNWTVKSEYFNKIATFQFDAKGAFASKSLSPSDQEVEEGKLVNGYRAGSWTQKNPYGHNTVEFNYKKGLLNGRVKTYQPNSSATRILGEYKNGSKTGTWKYFNQMGQTVYEQSFNNEIKLNEAFNRVPQNFIPVTTDSLDFVINDPINDTLNQFITGAYFIPKIAGTELLERGFDFYETEVELTPDYRDKDFTYQPVFVKPKFPGNERSYFKVNQLVPKIVEEEQIRGSVLVRFAIDEFGIIDKVNILRSVHPAVDKAVIAYLSQMPAWNPARYQGLPVRSYVLRRYRF
ncbi:energy transducer TonB [Salibacter sp.]|uniref:energy transducer TonB n=1 Tax=Salibacter sp. TaxID=2010995 RepID=UPI002870B225|nr:energy transducer TonB [Salibacter sp.]MDR9486733.1 energy transducer TonB [Salibacter sp.]